MIDSHCHLTDPRLFEQLDDVLSRARAAGVARVVTIGTDPDDAAAAIGVCERYPQQVRCAIGIHPNESGNFDVDAVKRIGELASHPSVVAIGEMGLDYFWKKVEPARQRRVFEAQLTLATEIAKPVVIHSREAIEQTLEVLRNYPSLRCVFHCFTGSIAEASAIVLAGHYVGFTGPITFKKNDILREAVRQVPDDRILIETDGPYLSPEPLRGKKACEPAFVHYTLATVAMVKGISLAEADELTTANTERFYGMEI
jgi:TatD DNase family protein